MTASPSTRPAPWSIVALVALACLGTALAVVPGAEAMGYDRFALPKELVAAIAILGVAAVRLLSRRPLALDGPTLCLGAVLALGVVSLAGATNQLLAVRGLGVIAVMVAAYGLGASLADDGRRTAVCAIVALTGAVLAATAIAEAHRLVPAWSMPGRAPGGTEGNRNFLAHGLALALPVAIALSLLGARRATRALAVLALASIAGAIVLSRSRGAWLGASASLVVTLVGLLATAPRRRAIVVPYAAIALGVVAAIAIPNRLAWGSSSPYADTLRRIGDHRDGTGRGRLIQYATTLEMIGDHPWLGVGPGNWSIDYPTHARPGDPSHTPQSEQPVNRLPNSDWLGAAAERGIPASLAFVGCLAWLLAATWRARRRIAGGGVRAATLTGVIAALAIGGAFDAVLLRPTPALLAGLALGALGHRSRGVAAGWTVPSRVLAIAACLTLAVAIGRAEVRALRAGRLAAWGSPAALERAARVAPDDYRISARLASLAARRRDCDEVTRWARATLAAYPQHGRSRRQLAACRHRDPAPPSIARTGLTTAGAAPLRSPPRAPR